MKYLIRLVWAGLLALVMIVGAPGQAPDATLGKAAREGDLARLKSLLDSGVNPNRRDGSGSTALIEAAVGGQTAAARALVAAGANPNLASSSGRTPLIAAAIGGRIEIARLLIAAGANLNIAERGAGTPLEAAEREGHAAMAALLRASGARTSGRSVGDKVCVRPWKGDGYCGVVLSIDTNNYRLRVTEIVGCPNGCRAIEECSAGKLVGGSGGLKAGDTITAAGSCLTHTGVSQ